MPFFMRKWPPPNMSQASSFKQPRKTNNPHYKTFRSPSGSDVDEQKKALETTCRECIMALFVSPQENLAEMDGFQGVDWLRSEAPWPPDAERRVHRYMHYNNLYQVRNLDEPVFVNLVNIVKSEAGVPNTRNWEQKVPEKCLALIKSSTTAWMRNGVLVRRPTSNRLMKSTRFQELWDAAIREAQARSPTKFSMARNGPLDSESGASTTNRDSVTRGAETSGVYFNMKRGAETTPESWTAQRAKRIRRDSSQPLRSDDSCPVIRGLQTGLNSDDISQMTDSGKRHPSTLSDDGASASNPIDLDDLSSVTSEPSEEDSGQTIQVARDALSSLDQTDEYFAASSSSQRQGANPMAEERRSNFTTIESERTPLMLSSSSHNQETSEAEPSMYDSSKSVGNSFGQSRPATGGGGPTPVPFPSPRPNPQRNKNKSLSEISSNMEVQDTSQPTHGHEECVTRSPVRLEPGDHLNLSPKTTRTGNLSTSTQISEDVFHKAPIDSTSLERNILSQFRRRESYAGTVHFNLRSIAAESSRNSRESGPKLLESPQSSGLVDGQVKDGGQNGYRLPPLDARRINTSSIPGIGFTQSTPIHHHNSTPTQPTLTSPLPSAGENRTSQDAFSHPPKSFHSSSSSQRHPDQISQQKPAMDQDQSLPTLPPQQSRKSPNLIIPPPPISPTTQYQPSPISKPKPHPPPPPTHYRAAPIFQPQTPRPHPNRYQTTPMNGISQPPPPLIPPSNRSQTSPISQPPPLLIPPSNRYQTSPISQHPPPLIPPSNRYQTFPISQPPAPPTPPTPPSNRYQNPPISQPPPPALSIQYQSMPSVASPSQYGYSIPNTTQSPSEGYHPLPLPPTRHPPSTQSGDRGMPPPLTQAGQSGPHSAPPSQFQPWPQNLSPSPAVSEIQQLETSPPSSQYVPLNPSQPQFQSYKAPPNAQYIAHQTGPIASPIQGHYPPPPMSPQTQNHSTHLNQAMPPPPPHSSPSQVPLNPPRPPSPGTTQLPLSQNNPSHYTAPNLAFSTSQPSAACPPAQKLVAHMNIIIPLHGMESNMFSYSAPRNSYLDFDAEPLWFDVERFFRWISKIVEIEDNAVLRFDLMDSHAQLIKRTWVPPGYSKAFDVVKQRAINYCLETWNRNQQLSNAIIVITAHSPILADTNDTQVQPPPVVDANTNPNSSKECSQIALQSRYNGSLALDARGNLGALKTSIVSAPGKPKPSKLKDAGTNQRQPTDVRNSANGLSPPIPQPEKVDSRSSLTSDESMNIPQPERSRSSVTGAEPPRIPQPERVDSRSNVTSAEDSVSNIQKPDNPSSTPSATATQGSLLQQVDELQDKNSQKNSSSSISSSSISSNISISSRSSISSMSSSTVPGTKVTVRLQADGWGRLSPGYDRSVLNPKVTNKKFFDWFVQETGREAPQKLRFDFKDALPPKCSIIERGNEDHFNLMVNDIKRKFSHAREYVPDMKEFAIVVTDPSWDADDAEEDEDW